VWDWTLVFLWCGRTGGLRAVYGHVITKFSRMGRFTYPWCSAGALCAPELRYYNVTSPASVTHNPSWDLRLYLGIESVSSWKREQGMAWIGTWNTWKAKLEKIETLTFSSFNSIPEKKNHQKILWFVLMDEICLILHNSTGTFCVWVKVPSNEFSTELNKNSLILVT